MSTSAASLRNDGVFGGTSYLPVGGPCTHDGVLGIYPASGRRVCGTDAPSGAMQSCERAIQRGVTVSDATWQRRCRFSDTTGHTVGSTYAIYATILVLPRTR